MKVILRSDIKSLGKRNDIKEVSDGYAANFLFPKKLAVPANTEGITKRNIVIKIDTEKTEHLRALAHQLEKEVFEFRLKTGPHGEVVNSITENDIKKAIVEKHSVEIKNVELPAPIKKLGDYEIIINMVRNITAKIKINACG